MWQKALISTEAMQEIIYQNPLSCLNDNSYSVFSQLWLALSLGHLYNNDGTKRWPSDKANHSCENTLSIIVIQAAKRILVNNFLASVDIKSFCRTCTYLQCCFFLASYFFIPRVFLFSISLLFVNINKCYSTLLVDYSHSTDHKQMICIKFQVHKPYWCMNVQWKFKEIVTWNFLKITFIMYHNCCTY